MKNRRLIYLLLSSSLIAFSSLATAASLELNWGSPEGYSDIKPGSSSTQRGFNKQLSSQLERHMAKLARELPEDQKLTMNFTDIQLAGNVDPVRGTDSVRIVQGNRYPAKMRFSYTLTDASGNTLKSGDESLSSTTSDVRTANKESFGVEKKMLTRWFNNTLK